MLRTRSQWNPGDRTIDDFSDEIITRPSGGGGALDCGFFDQVSDPDFSHSGDRAACAATIRLNAAGLQTRNGEPRSPAFCLTGYDLRYRLMPHWDMKERMLAVGIDPDAARAEAFDHGYERWDTDGGWLSDVKTRRHLEFMLPLLIAEQEVRVRGGEADPDRAAEEVVRVIVEEVSWPGRAPLTEAGEEALRDRLSAHFPAGPAPEI